MKKSKKLSIEKIIKKFFTDAGKNYQSITEPQRKELEQLDEKQLNALLAVKAFPLDKKIRLKLLKKISERLLNRIEKRIKIYKQVKEATEKGVYEAAEHLTSKLDW